MRITEKFPVTDTVTAIRMAPVDQYLPPFMAGQYIQVIADGDGIHTGRPYGISSAPSERAYYEISVRRKPSGVVSGYLIDTAQVGDIITTTAPAGFIYHNPVIHGNKQVLIAGGSGISPFLSMIREVTDRGLDREIHLIYGCRSLADVPYLEELQDRAAKHSNFKMDLVISEPDPNWTGASGFITADLIRSLNVDIDGSTFYICGPEAMYKFCIPEMEKLNIPRKRLRIEAFGTSDDITKDGAWPVEISGNAEFTITYGGKQIPAKASDTVLNSLEKAGIAHSSCCRSGECSVCRMKLVSGDVFEASTVTKRLADERANYIHTCATYPISDIEIAD